MARRFRNFRSNMVRSGRKTFWLAGLHVRSTMSAGSTAILVTSLNAAALALRPFTIVRTRGVFGVISDQVAVTEDAIVAYGETVITDQAVAIGVTAIPTPITDSGADWFVFDTSWARLQFASAVNVHNEFIALRDIDSKAMRKVDEGQDLVTVIETASISSGAIVVSFSRTLIKLH